MSVNRGVVWLQVLAWGKQYQSISLKVTDNRHVGLLSITGKEFHMEKIRLTTVRPFVMREIVLAEEPRFQKKGSDTTKEAVIKFLQEQVSLPPCLLKPG
jgi:hypothetical protein